jgi:hypothetical protein
MTKQFDSISGVRLAAQAPTQSASVDTSRSMPSLANDALCRFNGWCSPNLP